MQGVAPTITTEELAAGVLGYIERCKNTRIANDHANKLSEASVSLR
jgi:hypothetical protein